MSFVLNELTISFQSEHSCAEEHVRGVVEWMKRLQCRQCRTHCAGLTQAGKRGTCRPTSKWGVCVCTASRNPGCVNVCQPESLLLKLFAWGPPGTLSCVFVFIIAVPVIKLFAWGGVKVEDMCYEGRRAESCVD